MGVKNGSKTLHSVTGLTLADVAQMCKGLAAEQQILPRIVADCSNLLFVFSKCTSAVSAVAGHLSRIAATGVVMVPVCDGPIRPISKQATNKRIAEKELSRIKAYHCRAKVVELKNRLVQESLNQEERDAITGEIRKFDTQMKRNETQSQCRMPNNFASQLEYELNHSFAANCRVDSGYRLLMRCIRHAFDSRTKSLENKTAKLIVHQGEVGIHLSLEIPVSMKNSVYCSKIAVTPTKILCCKCSCYCGGQGNERILCVHNLPLLFLLTTLLFDALADNLLCDFAACLRETTWDKDGWSKKGRVSSEAAGI